MKGEMERKIAIVRGINVGGKRRILMSDLKALFAQLGLLEIQTYIQSGNVVFASEHSCVKLEANMEKTIQEGFGFEVPVIVRTADELENSVRRNPFYLEGCDINKLHLTFLKDPPHLPDGLEAEASKYQPDRFSIIDRDVFIKCEGKYHKSKLTNGFFEKRLQTGATTRNWKTVLKLMDLTCKT